MFVLLENVEPPHNKEYRIEVLNDGGWVVNVKYGRIGSTLQHRSYPFGSREDATDFANDTIETRFAHGYHVVDRDAEASQILPAGWIDSSEGQQWVETAVPTAVPVRAHPRRTRRGMTSVTRHTRRLDNARRINLRGEIISGGKYRWKMVNGVYVKAS
jgi:predicted DNA-binding WGR domain protein